MTIVHEPAVATAPALPAPTIRRRRVVAGLAALVAAAAVAALGTAAPWAWAGLGFSVVLSSAYAYAWHRSQRRDIERRFEDLVAGNEDFFAEMSSLAVSPEGPSPAPLSPAAPSVRGVRQTLALIRFAASYAAGWALAPAVFLLTIAVGRTPRDTTGQRWLANLRRTQAHLRDRSMRTLAVTATATASVTAVGGATLLTGGAGAYASPAPAASASVGPQAAVSIGTLSAGSSSSTYTVVSGDTLSSIAARFGTTWSVLASANHLSNPNLVFPGQVLTLGGAGAPAAPTAAGSTYTVRSGDTLSAIAGRFGTTWQALARINGLADPNFITVGEVLRVSGAAAVTTSPPAPASATASASSPAPAASRSAQTAVNAVLAQVGKPYQWAGAGPNSFDCSGLVMYAWAAAGVQLTHYTVSQYEETTRISQSQLQPGDLVFYDTGDGAQPGHVTMYIGGGRIVTADSPGTVVRVENLDWDGTPMGFGRVNR